MISENLTEIDIFENFDQKWYLLKILTRSNIFKIFDKNPISRKFDQNKDSAENVDQNLDYLKF